LHVANVNFYSTLRQIVGKKTVELSLPLGATVRQLIGEIVRSYPALRREMVNEQGELYGHVHIFINGRDSSFLAENLDTELDPDDTISVFPAVGGGAR
jgi:molybdopterin synthase sulfur carrier subunit